MTALVAVLLLVAVVLAAVVVAVLGRTRRRRAAARAAAIRTADAVTTDAGPAAARPTLVGGAMPAPAAATPAQVSGPAAVAPERADRSAVGWRGAVPFALPLSDRLSPRADGPPGELVARFERTPAERAVAHVCDALAQCGYAVRWRHSDEAAFTTADGHVARVVAGYSWDGATTVRIELEPDELAAVGLHLLTGLRADGYLVEQRDHTGVRMRTVDGLGTARVTRVLGRAA